MSNPNLIGHASELVAGDGDDRFRYAINTFLVVAKRSALSEVGRKRGLVEGAGVAYAGAVGAAGAEDQRVACRDVTARQRGPV